MINKTAEIIGVLLILLIFGLTGIATTAERIIIVLLALIYWQMEDKKK